MRFLPLQVSIFHFPFVPICVRTCSSPTNDPNCFSNDYVSVDRLQFLIYSDKNSYLVFNKEMCIINESVLCAFFISVLI